jgi:predicted nuclease with TOPRIM domain
MDIEDQVQVHESNILEIAAIIYALRDRIEKLEEENRRLYEMIKNTKQGVKKNENKFRM